MSGRSGAGSIGRGPWLVGLYLLKGAMEFAERLVQWACGWVRYFRLARE
jgi:hypothetical protein